MARSATRQFDCLWRRCQVGDQVRGLSSVSVSRKLRAGVWQRLPT